MNRYFNSVNSMKVGFLFIVILTLSACGAKQPSHSMLGEPSAMTAEEYYQKAMDYAGDRSYWEQPFEAFHLFKKAAELGHAGAQDRTGWGYQYGLGTERDLHRAIDWYRKAAEAGNAQAQTSLGFFLLMGFGGTTDQDKGLYWTRLAAEQNKPAALNNLGGIYERGLGVKRDYKQSVDYYRQAAALDYPLAQSNLGTMYVRGLGVDKDTATAFKLFLEGCTDKHRYGFAGCYNLLKNSDAFTDEQVDYSRARKILEDACRDNQPVACRFAALVYLNGWQVENDSARAADFFKQGCSMGDAPSCGMIGELYYFGDGVELDKELGKALLHEACINGDKPSCHKF